jgi:tRNA dimethylallyltransferase
VVKAQGNKPDVSEKRPYLRDCFFIVGPTATGKSELAAAVAQRFGAEVVSADAFQIYRGLDVLTAKPDPAILAKAPHHLIGAVPLSEEMNAEKYRAMAAEIIARGKPVIVVGGTGLYVKALTHGLATLPGANSKLREKLERTTSEELFRSLCTLDLDGAEKIDRQNRRRLIRAVEVCLLTGKPFSSQRIEWNQTLPENGVLVTRERIELYARINQRVDQMFATGVIEEVRALKNLGPTAEHTLGLREIRALLAGEISQAECIAKIQQATRRYAKRQLTWFQRQTNFASLNLSAHRPAEAVELISQSATRVFARG